MENVSLTATSLSYKHTLTGKYVEYNPVSQVKWENVEAIGDIAFQNKVSGRGT